MEDVDGPFIAVSDYMKSLPESIARFLPGRLVPLGTDGYGMSDTIPALRRHFEVDASFVVLAALDALRHDGKLDAGAVKKAIDDLGIDPDKIDPMSV